MFRRLLIALALAVVVLDLPGTAQAAEGTRYALLVGVIEYDHAKLPNLRYTENDVEELGEILRGSGFKVAALTTTRGKARPAAQPTAKNIRGVLERILSRVTKRDTVLVALAGHGLQLKVKRKDAAGREVEVEEAFFCPCNAKQKDTTDPKVLGETLIPLSEVFKQLDESGAGVKLLLVDACRNDPTLGRNVSTDSLPRPPSGMAAMFSCKGGERAFESPKLGRNGHGVFFHHVIEGLKGEAKNRKGLVTWDALAEYVKDKVSDEVPVLIGGGARQTPQEIKNLTGKSPVLVNPAPLATDADRLFRLAVAHDYGQDRKADLAEAVRCYRQAAEKGHPLALATVSLFQAFGVGMKSDVSAAVALARRAAPAVREAALKGDAVAGFLLGSLLFEGLGVERDYKEAMRWYLQAAEKGNVAAQTNLGDGYFYATGVEKDHKEAARWYRKAAEQGDPLGQYSLAWMHRTGAGVEKDLATAIGLFRKSAEQGCTASQNELGNAYRYGEGAEKSAREALKWYRRAAEGGNGLAQRWLGDLHARGDGVEKDDREAVKWYLKATEPDQEGKAALKWWYRSSTLTARATAQYSLGWMIEAGRVSGADRKDALKWYKLAAENGNALARKRLEGGK
jgi:TPR repeat protein